MSMSEKVISSLKIGLSSLKKWIPSDYYYDDRGSWLFELQCEQPDYYLYKCEKEILSEQSEALLRTANVCSITDLGCGNAEKLALMLECNRELKIVSKINLIDINQVITEAAKENILEIDDNLIVMTFIGDFFEGLEFVSNSKESHMVCLLGSTIGNLTDDQIRVFGQSVRSSLKIGDYFLVGADLDKNPAILTRAYNDELGITRLTNLNVLAHLNKLYRGNFDLSQFYHFASHFDSEKTMKSFLVSKVDQLVTLRELDLQVKLVKDEMILTEIERKFPMGKIAQLLNGEGFFSKRVFKDAKGWYSLELFEVVT